MQYYNNPNNFMPYTPLPTIQTQQPRNTFVWIQGGEATAANYPVAAGETVLLVDSDNPLIFFKSTDLSGKPQPMQKRYMVTEEDYKKIQNGKNLSVDSETYVTKEYFDQKISELENKFVIKRRDKS